MKTPHKHAELIKAWADGANIEYYNLNSEWVDCPSPTWNEEYSYRIKPEPRILKGFVVKNLMDQFVFTTEPECPKIAKKATLIIHPDE